MKEQKLKNKIALLVEILFISTRLGITSFGGPIAHLGYFHEEYVRRRKWMDEKSYADLVALCQFLPGPASSQVGIGIGVLRAGIVGGVIAFIGFTLPSVIVLILFALFVNGLDVQDADWIHGLKLVAVAVVAHAIIGMAKNLTPDLKRKAIALFSLVVTLLWQTAFTQVGVIIVASIVGYILFKDVQKADDTDANFPISRRLGAVCITLFFCLLLILPIAREVDGLSWLVLFDSFYRAGALVFGGGHVVLPFLERELVPTNLIDGGSFLAGYGAAQAVPGPLFTFASYLGTVINGWKGGLVATVAIFLPGFLLIVGALPFWNTLRRNPKIKGALLGVNAAVVGVLISSFYQPIWNGTIFTPTDFAFAAILFSLLAYWKLPAWSIVLIGIVGGTILSFI